MPNSASLAVTEPWLAGPIALGANATQDTSAIHRDIALNSAQTTSLQYRAQAPRYESHLKFLAPLLRHALIQIKQLKRYSNPDLKCARRCRRLIRIILPTVNLVLRIL